MKQRVATVIPVFQAQKDLEDTLDSLRKSSFSSTILVVDDGSRPPIEVPKDDPQLDIRLLRLPRNQGIVGALNAGITAALADGFEYIARIDAGDLATPNRLARQVAWLDAHPQCMVLGTDAEVRDENGGYRFTFEPPRDPAKLKRALHERCWLLHPTVMFRASVFKETGLYSDVYDAAEDYELFLRIAKKYEVGVVPEPLLIYIQNENSISARKARLQAVNRFKIQIKYFEWANWVTYYGLVRTCASLLMPQWAKRPFKLKFLYSRIPAPQGSGGTRQVMELRRRS